MALAAAGVPSKVLGYFRDLIAATSAFQTWTGAADTAAAKAFIFESRREFEESAVKTTLAAFAIVNCSQWSQVGMTGIYSGAVELMVEARKDSQYAGDAEQELREFNNNWSSLCQELISDSRADTSGAVLNTIHYGGEEIGEPVDSDEDEAATEGDYFYAFATFPWGPRGEGS